MRNAIWGIVHATLTMVVLACAVTWPASTVALDVPRLAAPPVKTPGPISEMVIDAAGNTFVSGVLSSAKTQFVSSTTYTNAGIGRLFVAKYAPFATTPSYVAVVGAASYYAVDAGGTGKDEWAAGLALDAAGNAYVVAYEADLKYPVTGGRYQEPTGKKYVWKISSTGSVSKLPKELDSAVVRVGAIAVDGGGGIWLTGSAREGLVTTAGALYPTGSTAAGCFGVYVMKLDPAGQNVLYSTYLGNSGTAGQLCGGNLKGDQIARSVSYPTGFAMTIDALGNVYVAGQAEPGLPATPGAVDLGTKVTNGGGGGFGFVFDPASHAFVTKLRSTGELIWNARYGGELRDRATSIAVDAAGSVVIAGKTTSGDLPVTGAAMEHFPAVYMDCLLWTPEVGFVARLTPDARQLVFSGYLALDGSELDNCYGSGQSPPAKLALDAAGNVYVTGFTIVSNRDFRSMPPRLIPDRSIFGDSILQIYSADGRQKLYSSALPGGGGPVALDSRGNVLVGGTELLVLSPSTWPIELISPKTYCCANTAFTLAATVAAAPDGGTVDFMSDGALIGSAPVVAGVATKSFTIAAVGVKKLKATYRGAGPFNSYSSPEVLLAINQAGTCP